MNIYLYIAAWTLLWAGAGPTMKVINQQLDGRRLPSFLLERRGQKFVSCTGLLLSACGVSLLIWGFMHLKWYFVLAWIFVGIIASIPIERICGSVLMIYIAWIPTLLLAGYLWFT